MQAPDYDFTNYASCSICGRIGGQETTLLNGTCRGGCKTTAQELEELIKLPKNKRRRAKKLAALAAAIAAADRKGGFIGGQDATATDVD